MDERSGGPWRREWRRRGRVHAPVQHAVASARLCSSSRRWTRPLRGKYGRPRRTHRAAETRSPWTVRLGRSRLAIGGRGWDYCGGRCERGGASACRTRGRGRQLRRGVGGGVGGRRQRCWRSGERRRRTGGRSDGGRPRLRRCG